MTVMGRGKNWKLQVKGMEHGVPHVHIRFNDGIETVISILDFQIIKGKVMAGRLPEILAHMKNNQEALLAEWRRLNP